MARTREDTPTFPRLRECRGCGLFQRLPATTPGSDVRCLRCDQVLHRPRRETLTRTLALALAGLALYAVAVGTPLMGLDLGGLHRESTIFTSARQFEADGLWGLALVVIATVVVLPLARLLVLAGVLMGLRAPLPPPGLHRLFRWYERIGPWAMIEVYLLGTFVAYTRLEALARVEAGPALWALGGLMFVTVAADAALDPQTVWRALERRGVVAGRAEAGRRHGRLSGGRGAALVACDVCQRVSLAKADHPAACPRCGALLHARKPDSLNRTWALLAAAAMLYIPANAYPVLTFVRFGQGQPSTILGGVVELAEAGQWPLAALVFGASFVVPLFKLVGLSALLIGVHRGWGGRLRLRTRLYRFVDAIGRWSMIDVFMLSVLVALVRLGFIASVRPGIGAMSFAAVVVLTMLAAASFDPRLMWDAAARRGGEA